MNYIGIKLLEAEPMTKNEYNKNRDRNVPGDDQEGYLVKYSSDYQSWSPKDVFEAAYLPLGEDNTRIMPEVIDSIIAEVTVGRVDPKTCLIHSVAVTGFSQYATAACVAPENYDEKIGVEIGMKEIKDKLWFAMGFVLQWAKYGLKNTPVVRQGA